MKKLSLLLLALSGAGLTACNSGSSSTQAPKQNTVANTESVTEQKLDASESIVLSNPLQGVHGTIGVAVTDGKNLDYYRDDKFIGIIHKFEDVPDRVQIAQVGIRGTQSTIIYVVTYSPNYTAKLIHKCVQPPSGGNFVCSQIYSTKEAITGIRFDGNGNGYALISDYGLVRFANDKVVDVRTDINGHSLDASGDTIFIRTTYSQIIRLNGFYDNYPLIYDTGKNFKSFSIDGELNGYMFEYRYLYSMYNGHVGRLLHSFEDNINGISSTGSAIYVGTRGKELKKCTPSGDCSTIDKFGDSVNDVSFREF